MPCQFALSHFGQRTVITDFVLGWRASPLLAGVCCCALLMRMEAPTGRPDFVPKTRQAVPVHLAPRASGWLSQCSLKTFQSAVDLRCCPILQHRKHFATPSPEVERSPTHQCVTRTKPVTRTTRSPSKTGFRPTQCPGRRPRALRGVSQCRTET